MKLTTTLEFRKFENKLFKGNDGRDIEMTIVTFIDEDDNKIKLTVLRGADVDLVKLVKGRQYTLDLSTAQMSLFKDNDLATMYLTKFKIVTVIPFSPVGSGNGGTK